MRKVGCFFKSCVPILLALLFMIVAAIPVEIFYMIKNLDTGGDIVDSILNALITSSQDTTVSMMINVVYSILGILVFIPWYRKVFVRPFKNKTKTQPGGFSFHTIVSLIFLGIGLQYICAFMVTVMSQVKPDWVANYNTLIDAAGLNDANLLILVYTIILAPLVEELIFRGLTFRYARYAFPFWVANVWQALLFGAFHMNIVQGIYAFVIGLFLGYICHKGRGLKYSIVLHIIFNFFGMIAGDLINTTLKLNEYAFYGIGIALTVFALWLFSSDFRSAPEPVSFPNDDEYDYD